MKTATAAEQRYMGLISTVPCLVCSRFQPTGKRVELHHIAEGSGLRSNWAIVPLCEEHHRGGSGLHGMGVKGFCSLYRPQGEVEYGLMVWLQQDLEKLKLLKVAGMKQIEGQLALERYQQALALVKLCKFDEARAVEMRTGDRVVIEAHIRQAQAKQPSSD